METQFNPTLQLLLSCFPPDVRGLSCDHWDLWSLGVVITGSCDHWELWSLGVVQISHLRQSLVSRSSSLKAHVIDLVLAERHWRFVPPVSDGASVLMMLCCCCCDLHLLLLLLLHLLLPPPLMLIFRPGLWLGLRPWILLGVGVQNSDRFPPQPADISFTCHRSAAASG